MFIAVSSVPVVSFGVSMVLFRCFDGFGGSACFGGFAPVFRVLVHAASGILKRRSDDR